MTQEELKKQLEDAMDFKDIEDAWISLYPQFEESIKKSMTLINQHVSEVIGKNEGYAGDLREDSDAIVINNLKNEQRKRAGL